MTATQNSSPSSRTYIGRRDGGCEMRVRTLRRRPPADIMRPEIFCAAVPSIAFLTVLRLNSAFDAKIDDETVPLQSPSATDASWSPGFVFAVALRPANIPIAAAKREDAALIFPGGRRAS